MNNIVEWIIGISITIGAFGFAYYLVKTAKDCNDE
jgi:hypothetical protein